MGTPKTPTKILEARGSWRAKLRHDEPEPSIGEPDYIPSSLDEQGVIEWNDLYPKLRLLSIVTEVDVRLLERYCIAFSLWRNEIKDMDKISHTNFDRLNNSLLKMERELGMTPSARASLSIDPGKGNRKKEGPKKYHTKSA